VRLVIAGAGDVRADLESQCARLGLQHQVRFLGATLGLAKTYLLQNAFCTVMPSRTWEAFPLVVLESYAAGKPVIGTRIPGLEDLVEPGRTGWLVPPDDPAALAQALQQAHQDKAAMCAMGEHARQTAERYAWPTVAALHIELYRDLMANRLAKAG